MKEFAPCPKCTNINAEQLSFTWWGGILGPKILTHVKCRDCGTTFNGKTGKDNTTNIVIYSILVGLIVLFLFICIIATVVGLTFLN